MRRAFHREDHEGKADSDDEDEGQARGEVRLARVARAVRGKKSKRSRQAHEEKARKAACDKEAEEDLSGCQGDARDSAHGE